MLVIPDFAELVVLLRPLGLKQSQAEAVWAAKDTQTCLRFRLQSLQPLQPSFRMGCPTVLTRRSTDSSSSNAKGSIQPYWTKPPKDSGHSRSSVACFAMARPMRTMKAASSRTVLGGAQKYSTFAAPHVSRWLQGSACDCGGVCAHCRSGSNTFLFLYSYQIQSPSCEDTPKPLQYSMALLYSTHGASLT